MKLALLLIAATVLSACNLGSKAKQALNQTQNVAVPNVVGDTQAAATTAITGAGLTLGTVTMQASATVTSGSVISESPAAAASVASGSAVNLVVSSGPAMVAVPNVVGNTRAAATTAITGAGLTLGTVTMQASATVASGSVISESPAAATSVASGSAVNLTVSSGPAMVAVPNVVGSTQAAATTAITGAGLTVGTVTMQSSGTVASGSVISESPAAATSVASGSAVNLVVSSGVGTSTPQLGGIVIGLATGVTVSVLNGTDTVPVTANGTFTFPTLLATGANYSVTVGTQPTGQTCGVQNAAGTAGSANITNVVVYCTHNVTVATLTGTYDFVGYNVSTVTNGLFTETFDGAGNRSGTGTTDANATITTGVADSGTYVVAANSVQVPVLTDSGNNIGGILGADGDVFIWLANTSSGQQPAMAAGVKQPTSASVASLNGTYTIAALDGTSPAPTGFLYAGTFTNGSATLAPGLQNANGTVTASSSHSGTYTVSSSGAITFGTGGAGLSGAVSADGDLVVMAPITSNGNGSTSDITVAVKQGSGLSAATFDGVYTNVALGGTSTSGSYGLVETIYAHGDGTYTGTYTFNNAGTVTTGNPDSGTYTVSANGALVITSQGVVSTGQISADGNVYVLSDVNSGQPPAVAVGVRQ
jgi:beta-lactam-binding protein with PASTA domain